MSYQFSRTIRAASRAELLARQAAEKIEAPRERYNRLIREMNDCVDAEKGAFLTYRCNFDDPALFLQWEEASDRLQLAIDAALEAARGLSF